MKLNASTRLNATQITADAMQNAVVIYAVSNLWLLEAELGNAADTAVYAKFLSDDLAALVRKGDYSDSALESAFDKALKASGWTGPTDGFPAGDDPEEFMDLLVKLARGVTDKTLVKSMKRTRNSVDEMTSMY